MSFYKFKLFTYYLGSFMKRIFLVACFLGLAGISSFTYANAASPQVNNQSLSSPPQFEFTIGALWLKPSSSLLDYAVLGYPLPVNSPHWDVSAVNPSYSTGFTLGARYYI